MLKNWRLATAMAAAIGLGSVGLLAGSATPAHAQADMSNVSCSSSTIQNAITAFRAKLGAVKMSGNPDKDYTTTAMIMKTAMMNVDAYGMHCAKSPKVQQSAMHSRGATKKEQVILQDAINGGGGG